MEYYPEKEFYKEYSVPVIVVEMEEKKNLVLVWKIQKALPLLTPFLILKVQEAF